MDRQRESLLARATMVVALLLTVPVSRAQAPAPQQVAAGVWFLQGDARAGDCNSVLIEMSDYLILVDPSYPARTLQLMKTIPQLSSKPVRYVIDTHAHRDHAYGNVLWTRAGATTVAAAGVREEMRRYEPERWRMTAASREDVAALHWPTAEPPQRVFHGTRLRLHDRTREVDLLYLGWGHTRGDGWVWLPRERILCTGDAAVNGPRNKLWDANVRNWPRVIDKAAALQPTRILPGHGEMGGAEILTGQASFLRDLYAQVKTQLAQGVQPAAIASGLKFPSKDAPWVRADMLQDVEIVATEVRSGQPAGALPHTWQ